MDAVLSEGCSCGESSQTVCESLSHYDDDAYELLRDTLIDCMTSCDIHGDLAFAAARLILSNVSGLYVAATDAFDIAPRPVAAVVEPGLGVENRKES